MAKIIRPKNKIKIPTLREFVDRRNDILIYRGTGGLGDILMHRMIFEDFKDHNKDIKIHFACPAQYIEAVKDHPYIDQVLSSTEVDTSDYPVCYNTTSACTRYEMGTAPIADKHRSDIWAEHCGVVLKHHDMHIQLTPAELDYGERFLKQLNPEKKPSVIFCPISAMNSKNLQQHHVEEIIKELRAKEYYVYCIHNRPVEQLKALDVPVLFGQSIRQWMSIIMAANYVLTVDTAAFHFAGAMNKFTTGIFTWADGLIYGMYYKNVKIVQLHRKTHPDWTCGPCYNWVNCPFTRGPLKPCLTKLTSTMILDGFYETVDRSKGFVKLPILS